MYLYRTVFVKPKVYLYMDTLSTLAHDTFSSLSLLGTLGIGRVSKVLT